MQTENKIQKDSDNKDSKSWKRGMLDFFISFIIALFIANLLTIFVFTLSQVQQSSMERTLSEGNQLIVERISYTFGKPEREDIIVFVRQEITDNSVVAKFIRLYGDMWAKLSGEPQYTRQVKRVIGLPGDEINIQNGKVFVNGIEKVEGYAQTPTIEKSNIYPFIVPEDQYFVMGDNRPVSSDSREYGCIKRQQIEGKVWLRFWPLNKFGTIK